VSARVGWLVAATTSAVILAFVVPLCLLVRELAQDRAMAAAEQEARNVAILVSQLQGAPSLPRLVADVDADTPAKTSLLTPDGSTLGTAADDLVDDPDVRRAAKERRAFTIMTAQGGKVLVPVVTESGTFVVRTSVPTSVLRSGVRAAWAGIVTLGLALLILSVAIAIRLGRRVSTPVTELARVANRLGSGDLVARAPATGPPEVVALARSLNVLAERVQVLLEAERARVGDLSHRLRTPVTALRLDVDAVGDPVLAQRLEGHITTLQRTIDSVVHDARRPLEQPLTVGSDFTTVAHDRLVFWSALADDQGRTVTVTLPQEPLPVRLDRAALTDVIDVLVDNVFAHTDDQVEFRVLLSRDRNRARLEVSDDGPGLASDAPGGRRLGSTGQGLQIVRRIVANAEGEVVVGGDHRGTTVTVWLPLARDS
jgi:signal transduction histidine kinase